MNTEYNRWKKLFLFCLGLAMASAFCMKWMESDFWVGDEKFTILGLELFYPAKKVAVILSGIDPHVKTILSYHLSFDFAFMAGVYPGITALCMMARYKKNSSAIKNILLIVAFLQIIAWGCDIIENCFLLKWIHTPEIGTEFTFYHLVVITKWGLALFGTLLAIPLLLFSKRK